jgi:peptide/nickel transport system permease protein
MLLEAALSFLGLGVQPPEPSLGTMLNESRNYLGQADWFAIFPGLVLVALLMAVNFLSDGLHEILLPRRS